MDEEYFDVDSFSEPSESTAKVDLENKRDYEYSLMPVDTSKQTLICRNPIKRLCLTGAIGVGKSTTLKTIGDLLTLNHGYNSPVKHDLNHRYGDRMGHCLVYSPTMETDPLIIVQFEPLEMMTKFMEYEGMDSMYSDTNKDALAFQLIVANGMLGLSQFSEDLAHEYMDLGNIRNAIIIQERDVEDSYYIFMKQMMELNYIDKGVYVCMGDLLTTIRDRFPCKHRILLDCSNEKCLKRMRDRNRISELQKDDEEYFTNLCESYRNCVYFKYDNVICTDEKSVEQVGSIVISKLFEMSEKVRTKTEDLRLDIDEDKDEVDVDAETKDCKDCKNCNKTDCGSCNCTTSIDITKEEIRGWSSYIPSYKIMTGAIIGTSILGIASYFMYKK